MQKPEQVDVKVSKQDFLPQWIVMLNGTPLSSEPPPRLVVVTTKTGDEFRVSEQQYLELEFYGLLLWIPYNTFTVIQNTEANTWELHISMTGKRMCWLMSKEVTSEQA